MNMYRHTLTHTQVHLYAHTDTHSPTSFCKLKSLCCYSYGELKLFIIVRRKQATEIVERNFLELLDYLGTQLYTHTDTKHMESGVL